MADESIPAPLAYATPQHSRNPLLWAGFWILFSGLVLIFFGGCFCIGIMFTVGGAYPNHSSPGFFLAVLYVFAFACFLGGAGVFIAGLRKLLSVGR